MKAYHVTRSLYGELGSLKRNAILLETDPRLKNKKRHVDDLVKRGLLLETTAEEGEKSSVAGGARRQKGKAPAE